MFWNEHPSIYKIKTHGPGPDGELPLTPQMLKELPNGNIFGMTLNAGMGWDPALLNNDQYLIISTKGGIRGQDGTPIALGYHVGHWELDIQIKAAANEIARLNGIPFAGFVTDQCDGRAQGTTGMFESLPYRNDAAVVFRRLIRSIPTRHGVMGIATCDKGLPATMMALASMQDLPTILVPGGSTLPPTVGEDCGKVQTINARYTNGELTLKEAARLGCSSCGSAGGGCQFLGTASTSQMVAEGLGLALPHTALAPSGQAVWEDAAKQSAQALIKMKERGITTKDIITDKAVENAMALHAAIGGSTNLILHIPAIAHAAGCRMPTFDDWVRVNKQVPRIVSVLPNGPVNHPTVRVFLAGGAPEVMLHLRDLGLIHEDALTVTGQEVGTILEQWEKSERRTKMKELLQKHDGIDPTDVIMSLQKAKARGIVSTATFPKGNIAPEGAVVKSTSIDPTMLDKNHVYSQTGPAKVFTSENAAITAIKESRVKPGDIMILMGGGPMGTGMEETSQVTSALRHLSYGKEISLITDARFSGASTGACIGHAGPEALAGGPIGKLQDGDIIEIIIDCQNLEGSVNFIGTASGERFSHEEGARILQRRPPHPDLKPHPMLSDDTRLWAALQSASGGTWRGSVYDVDRIIEVLDAGKKALGV